MIPCFRLKSCEIIPQSTVIIRKVSEQPGEDGAGTCQWQTNCRVSCSLWHRRPSTCCVFECAHVCMCEETAGDRWHVILSSSALSGPLTRSLTSYCFAEQHSPEKFLETSMVVRMAPCRSKQPSVKCGVFTHPQSDHPKSGITVTYEICRKRISLC